MIKDWSKHTHSWLSLHWKRVLIFGGGGSLAALTLMQLLYPTDELLPFTSVEQVGLSGWSKADAIKVLDARYAQVPIAIYFGEASQPYQSPTPAEIGITISNQQRIDAIDYPWYLRIAPGSLFWAHLAVAGDGAPQVTRNDQALNAYITKELGESCRVLPKNATLTVTDGNITVQKSQNGGTCSLTDVRAALTSTSPSLINLNRVTIPVEVVAPDVGDQTASDLSATIGAVVSKGIAVTAGAEVVMLPKEQLIGWLDFAVTEGALDFSFNSARANDYLQQQLAAKVAVAPGVTKIATYDFVETSRQDGPAGQTLDVPATLGGLKGFITGDVPTATAMTAPVAPSLQYDRSYSPTHVGLSALMQFYAESHPGTYAVALTELSGSYRRATYNGTLPFTTASTYKLFVAYSTLKRVEAGSWHWSDQIQGGRDLSTCFDDMIVKSDNACAEALLTKVGYNAITAEARAIGCTSTSFLGNDGIKTTAGDLALLLAMVQSGQVLNQQSSRDRLIGAMKRNVYRQGIPRGVVGTVANKVGFLNALLNDAAIVYNPTGTYVLVVMTNGASWANIAELTRQIEALRIR